MTRQAKSDRVFAAQPRIARSASCVSSNGWGYCKTPGVQRSRIVPRLFDTTA
jgi:hypothetical protein